MIFERVTYIVQAAQYINVNTKDTLIDGLHCDRRIDTVLKINMIFEHVAYIYIYIYIYTKILEVNLFAFAYRLFRRDFSPLDGTYCMGTHSFLQPYIHFVLIWEGFMNGQSWSLLLQFSVLIS